MSPSALPLLYSLIFRYYEPVILIFRFVLSCLDPKQIYDAYSPSASAGDIPIAASATIVQRGSFSFLFALSNLIYLALIPSHLSARPDLQERFLLPYFALLFVGDLINVAFAIGAPRGAHSAVALGLDVLELSLLAPRIAWLVGFGRYVEGRDGPATKRKQG